MSEKDTPKPKNIADLPVPAKLTREDLERADDEASKWRAAVRSGTEQLERISAEDLQIRLR